MRCCAWQAGRAKAIWIVVWTASSFPSSSGAEFGDWDGDGRISIRDVSHFEDGIAPVPGAGESDWACFLPGGRGQLMIGPALQLEALRRNTASPVPNYFAAWPQDASQGPLAPSDSVEVQVDSVTVPGWEDSEVPLTLRLRTVASIRRFEILLEADESVLELAIPPALRFPETLIDWWYPSSCAGSRLFHGDGDVPVCIKPDSFLVSGGKVVLSFMPFMNSRSRDPIPAGEHTIRATARLRRGTARRTYALKVLEASEVLLSDDRLVAPRVGAPASLEVMDDVVGGVDDPVPAIVASMDDLRVHGKVEFRVTDAEGYPGDTVSVAVQLRTEIPINSLYTLMWWPHNALICAGLQNAFVRPIGETMPYYEPALLYCNPGSASTPPSVEHYVFLTGACNSSEPGFDTGRVLEYFRPVNEWVDLYVLNVTISPSLPGGTVVPLHFQRREDFGIGSVGRNYPTAMLSPYLPEAPCDPFSSGVGGNWQYDITYVEGEVRVLGDDPGEPVPPEETGVGFVLGDARGRPGEIVEIPVSASAQIPLAVLRLALEGDPGIAVERLTVHYIDNRDGRRFDRTMAPGEFLFYEQCDPPGTPGGRCTLATPVIAFLYPDLQPQQALVDFRIGDQEPFVGQWLGPDLREIAVLRVRIAESALEGSLELRRGKVALERYGLTAESGGFIENDGYRFGPAVEVEGGRITVEANPRFLRGDCNGDGDVAGSVSDAVYLLQYNFLGGAEPPCLAACDANGDGLVAGQVSDAVFLLNFNFMGGEQIPEPFPDCGLGNASDDVVGCAHQNCP